MGLLRWIGSRSRWLAQRLWVIAAADVALTSYRHWRRLEPEERERLLGLAKKSKGRPNKNLTAKERRQAADLLDKLGHIELAGSVAGIVLPFKPLTRLATKFLRGRQGDDRARRKETSGSADREPKRAKAGKSA
jgi:hypothetical protein